MKEVKSGYDLTCKICGNEFRSHTPVAKTCSKPCQKKYRREYARAYYGHPDNIERYREQVRQGVRKWRLKPGVKEKQYKNLLHWRRNNPERVKLIKQKDHQNHPERVQASHRRRKAVVKGGGLYPKEGVVRHRMDLFDGCCYCKSADDLTLEHLTALSKGGHNGVCNLLGACRKCNTSKQDRNWKDWFKQQTFYDVAREKSIILACNQ